jgi:hypothetical protein
MNHLVTEHREQTKQSAKLDKLVWQNRAQSYRALLHSGQPLIDRSARCPVQ